MQKIVYPIYFLDFEAINYAVPMFDRTRALSPLVFQYSLHILNSPKSRLKHDEFLAPSDADPRRAIAERLCGTIGENGTVVAFGATFERTVIRELAELFPDLRAKLQSIAAKTVDLMIPFEKRWFYHPKMHGSCSLKSVAPAIDSKAAYDGAIKNGIGAMERYLGLLGETDETAIASRKELLSYCEKDTLYMVSIFRALTRAAR
ncbi:hypothetical protein AGMMS49521_3620 [Campylobacterota bacterium]|nr:hypothetical protein AGMMS49521_3620 [Campylobacterota bacterium]